MPTSFKAYREVKDVITSDDVKRRLHRFTYRYRLASVFESINVVHDGDYLGRSKAGYEAGMKVFLAFTAYDEIHRAARYLDRNNVAEKQYAISSNTALAQKIRKNDRLKCLLLGAHNNADLQNNLDNFYKTMTSDILCIACGVRNLFAHGEFTAGGAGLDRKADCLMFEEIAKQVLEHCDRLFTISVQALIRRKNRR